MPRFTIRRSRGLWTVTYNGKKIGNASSFEQATLTVDDLIRACNIVGVGR